MHTGRHGHGHRHHGHHGRPHGPPYGYYGWGGWPPGYGYPWAAYPYEYVELGEPWWLDSGVVVAGSGRLGTRLGTVQRQNLGTLTQRSGRGELG